MAKVTKTFSLGKLAKKLDTTIVDGLNQLIVRLNKSIQQNLESQKDIRGNPYKDLSESTGSQRIAKQGYYKQSGGGGILNYTGNMKKTTVTKAKPGPEAVAKIEMTGKRKGVHYGAYHNQGGGKLPKREWFGITKDMKPGGKELKTALGLIKLGIRRGWKK